MLHTLFQTSLQFPQIQRFDEHFVLDILVDDGQARGLVAMNMMEGSLVQIRANAVVMATGGAGRVYRYNTNGGIVTGTTIGVIGEKSYDEAVIPLRSSVLESLASYLIPGMQNTGTDGEVTVNVNNYGDINNGSDYDGLMNDIAASVAAGTRGVRFAV